MRSDLIVQGWKKTRAIPEPFYFMSLDIDENYSVNSSLENYFNAEEIEDFKLGSKYAEAN